MGSCSNHTNQKTVTGDLYVDYKNEDDDDDRNEDADDDDRHDDGDDDSDEMDMKGEMQISTKAWWAM